MSATSSRRNHRITPLQKQGGCCGRKTGTSAVEAASDPRVAAATLFSRTAQRDSFAWRTAEGADGGRVASGSGADWLMTVTPVDAQARRPSLFATSSTIFVNKRSCMAVRLV